MTTMGYRLFGRSVVTLMTAMCFSPALATETRTEIVYKAYYAGINMARLELEIGLGGASYNVRSRITMSGLAGRLMPWKMIARAQGLRRGDAIEPLASDQWNDWGGDERFISLRFLNGIPEVTRLKPNPESDNRPRVPFAERQATVDPVGGILTLLIGLEGKDECRTRIPVFDGRRRYDLVAEPDGREHLKRSRRSPFSGNALRCILWMDKKAGFKKATGKGRYDRRALVWMARIFDDHPPVPVRLKYETRFGVAHGYIAKATLERNGVRTRLAARSFQPQT